MSSATPPDGSHWTTGRLPELAQIRERLQLVFPSGVDDRSWAVAERAAKSLFVFLYAFAVEGVTGNRLRPAMVTSMSDSQASLVQASDRLAWWDLARRPRKPGEANTGRWYEENTREPIRDETFRAWKEYGALLEDQIATAASTPRYQLARDFADLFDPLLRDDEFAATLSTWQARHLSTTARARLALLQRQTVASTGTIVRFPDGTTRSLAVEPSTPLVQAVIEQFAPSFLRAPVVLAVTESRQRVAYDDAAQLKRIGLTVDERLMPDVLLADLDGPQGELRLVFIECVATGGAMTPARLQSIRLWLNRNNLGNVGTAFGTVFPDKGSAMFRRYVSDVAWNTFVWCASEPTRVLILLDEGRYDPRMTLDTVTA